MMIEILDLGLQAQRNEIFVMPTKEASA